MATRRNQKKTVIKRLTMAIVKATYTRERPKIKASLRYYTHRPNSEGSRSGRVLFGKYGRLTKLDVYKMIDGAQKGTYFYRLVFSPDPKTEDQFRDIDLERFTRTSLARFSAQRFRHSCVFAAVAHTDHTDHRHVHVIALFPKKLSIADLNRFRAIVTEAAQSRQRQQENPVLLGERPKQGAQTYFPPSQYGNASISTHPSRHLVFRVTPSVSTPVASSPSGSAPAVILGKSTRVCPLCNAPARLTWREGKLVCQRCGYEPPRHSRRFSLSQQNGLELTMKGAASV